jgi:hypothetical protein
MVLVNLMQIPASLPADEYCETIVTGGDVLIERIISSGHAHRRISGMIRKPTNG